MFTHLPWNQSSHGPSHPIIQVWSSGLRQMQKSSVSSMSSSSSCWPTEELRVGVADSCLRFFGAGVLLARLEVGVAERFTEGVPSMLSVSSLRFFVAGLTALAVPFLGAARFLVGAGFGFANVVWFRSSTVLGEGLEPSLSFKLAIVLDPDGCSMEWLCSAEVASCEPTGCEPSSRILCGSSDMSSVTSAFTLTCPCWVSGKAVTTGGIVGVGEGCRI